MPAEPRVHDRAARRREHEQERAEKLGEHPPPLVAFVKEVELLGQGVRLAERTQASHTAAYLGLAPRHCVLIRGPGLTCLAT